MKKAVSLILGISAILNTVGGLRAFAAEEKIYYPADDVSIRGGSVGTCDYTLPLVSVRGNSSENAYFYFQLDKKPASGDKVVLEIEPYAMEISEECAPNLLLYSISKQDGASYNMTAANAPSLNAILSRIEPKIGEKTSVDVTSYVKGSLSKKNNICFALKDADPYETVYEFKSRENTDGASVRLVVYENGDGNVYEGGAKASSSSSFTQRNLTLDAKPVTYSKDMTGVDIDKYTTTRYKPWMVNYHLAEPYQIENDYYGGDCGQAPYNIAINPNDPNMILIGSDMQSVYRTEDGGVTWKFSAYGIIPVGTQGLSFHPDDGNIAFALMGEGATLGATNYRIGSGLYKSTDAGLHWTLVHPHITGYSSYTRKGGSFAYGPKKEDGTRTIFAGSYNGGVLRSDDMGDTWQYVDLKNKGLGFIRAYDNVVITGANGYGIFISRDGGKTFENPDPFPTKQVLDVIVDPDDKKHWYACVNDMVFESFDEGYTWEFMLDVFELAGECYADGTGWNQIRVGWLEFMAPDENGNRTLLAAVKGGRYTIRYSEDRGKTWHTSTLDRKMAYIESNWGSSSDPIAVHPTNPDIAWHSFDGEWFKTVDGGKTWRPSASGYSGHRAVGFWFNPDNEDDMWIFYTDRGYTRAVLSGNGEEYPAQTSDMSEDTYDMRFDGIRDMNDGARDPKNKDRFLMMGKKGTLLESLDGGWTWKIVNLPKDGTNIGYTVMFSPTDPNRIYAGNYRSDDDGKTWSKLDYKVMAVCPMDGNLIYAINPQMDSQIYKSYDGGKTWKLSVNTSSSIRNIRPDVKEKDKAYYGTFHRGIFVDTKGEITKLTGMFVGQGELEGFYDLAQNPNNPDHLIASNLDHVNSASAVGVSESFDGGKTWRLVDGLVGFGDAWCIEFHPTKPKVYFGTSHGVFVYEYDKYYDMSERTYRDIENNEVIDTLYEKRILNQYHDGNFYPDGAFTRGEFCEMVKKAFNLKSVSQKHVFSDINIYSRDFVNVGALYENGLVSGDTNSAFSAGRDITMDEVMVICDRILNKYGMKPEPADVNLEGISHGFAHGAVKRCIGAGVISGTEGYNGANKATRLDVCNILYRLMKITKTI